MRRHAPLLLVALLAGCGEVDSSVDADEDDLGDLDTIEYLDGAPPEDKDALPWGDDADEDASDAPDDLARADAAMDARPDAAADVARPDAVADVARVDAPDAPDAGDAGAPYNFPTPIHRVVVLVRENRTFDHLFAGFPGAESRTYGLRSDGSRVPLARAPAGDLPGDIRHNHNGALMAYRGGRMNGFDLNAARYSDTRNPLGPFLHYAEDQIPNYWRLARRFTLCDHFHSTMLAGSSPGHLTFWAAQSPLIDNPDCDGTLCAAGGGCFSRASEATTYNQDTCAIAADTTTACFDVPTLVDRFPAALTWRAYAHVNAAGVVSPPLDMTRGPTRDRAAFLAHAGDQTDLVADLRAGRVPNLLIAHIGGAVGEHPPNGLCHGENFAVDVVNAVMNGPYWRETAILITYDDWGGFYDHVAPPQERCGNGSHVRLGFRLPMIVVSPYAHRGADLAHPWVFHGVADQASVPRLVEDLLRLPRMAARDPHARDARAGSLLGAFDFAHPDFSTVTLTRRTCP